MGTWLYRKPEPFTLRGICVKCNERPQRGKTRNGVKGYLALCSSCSKEVYEPEWARKNIHQRKYYKMYSKELSCNSCGFTAVHPCQLDIDHIDGDHSNNSLENLQTLCANCHRLKTSINNENKPRR